MGIQEIKNLIHNKLPEAILGEDLESTPNALIIEASQLLNVCRLLYESDQTYFDSLSCLTGLDNGPETGTMEVIYNLYSIPKNSHLMLKVTLDRKNPKIETVTSIWKTADWHEREAYDLLGIKFQKHPNLRRILLPADWTGHPLRKDYTEQKYYHGMTVKYDRGKAPDDIPQIKKQDGDSI